MLIERQVWQNSWHYWTTITFSSHRKILASPMVISPSEIEECSRASSSWLSSSSNRIMNIRSLNIQIQIVECRGPMKNEDPHPAIPSLCTTCKSQFWVWLPLLIKVKNKDLGADSVALELRWPFIMGLGRLGLWLRVNRVSADLVLKGDLDLGLVETESESIRLSHLGVGRVLKPCSWSNARAECCKHLLVFGVQGDSTDSDQ